MKTLNLNKWVLAVALAATSEYQLTAQAPQKSLVIVVSIEDRKLALVEDGQLRKVYTVAVGKPSTPSPIGTFKIVRRVANPVYQHDGVTIKPGPGNPVGTRWMGLSLPGYGIHGTNVPRSIGKASSHGCIRMANGDLEELYSLVSVGDTVELIGQRNNETATLFGNPQGPPSCNRQCWRKTLLPRNRRQPLRGMMLRVSQLPPQPVPVKKGES